jgi:hypothetical protein
VKLLQFSPHAGTRVLRTKRTNSELWGAASLRPADAGFLRSWLEQNCDPDSASVSGINWNAVSGLALCFVVSAAFWSVIALFAERVFK